MSESKSSSKKDEMRFCIRFNPTDPRHRKAAQMLNAVGRRKACLVANALWECGDALLDDNFVPGVKQLSAGSRVEHDYMPQAASSEPKSDVVKPALGSADDTLQKSVLSAIGQFRDN